jgi:hypothetical protein
VSSEACRAAIAAIIKNDFLRQVDSSNKTIRSLNHFFLDFVNFQQFQQSEVAITKPLGFSQCSGAAIP